MENINTIRKLILDSKSVAIAGHTSPDGDAIGASLALAMGIKKLGKDVKVLLETYSAPGIDKYDLIPGKELVIFDDFTNINAQLFIAVDCGDKERLGVAVNVFDKAVNTLNIDHHPSNSSFGDFNLVRTTSSSTSEIIFDVLDGFCELDEKIATALYTGLLFDTGGFRHSATTSNTFRVASELTKFNVPITELYDRLYYSRSYSAMKILGRAIEKAQKIMDGQVIYTVITSEEIKESNSDLKELDEVVNCLKSVKGTELAVFFYQKGENVYKASFRSQSTFDCCKLAGYFGGGGHVKASGCAVEGSQEEVINKVLDKIKEMF